MSREDVRFHAFDLLRALAMFAVVWIHGCDTSMLTRHLSVYAHFAVPVFVLMSFFLLQRSLDDGPAASIRAALGKRLMRLLPAYLVWTVLYMVVRTAKHRATGSDASPDDWVSALFFGGASYQLYFVALLIYWMVVFLPLMMLLARNPRRWHAVALAAAGFLLLWIGPHIHDRMPAPAAYSMLNHATALTGYVPLGIAAGVGWRAGFLGMQQRTWLAWFFLLVACAGLWLKPDARLVISVSLLLAAVTRDWPAMPEPIRRCSRLSFGIFMVHGFFVEGLQWFLPKAGLSVAGTSGALAVILGSFAASYLVCEGLWHFKRIRWMVA